MIKRAKKNRKGKIAVLVVFLFLLLILFLGSLKMTAEVSGNRQYTSEQIQEILFDSRWSRNPVYFYVQSIFGKHKTIPFVEDYRIVFVSPVHVKVIIYEKSVVGYVSYMSSNMYFDKDGIIVESTNERLDGIPLITGLKFGHIVLHQPLPVKDPGIFEEILNLTQILSTKELQVDKIHYNSKGEADLTVDKLVVKLGSNEDMSGKISELGAMLKDYKDLDGTLYLDTYSDENTNSMFRFEAR